MNSKKEMVVGLPLGCVMTLKELTDLISVDHSKAMKKVAELEQEEGFGRLAILASRYSSGNGAIRTINTFALTETQAIACGARLNNSLLMKVINRVKVLEAPTQKAINTKVTIPAIEMVAPMAKMLASIGVEENFAKFQAIDFVAETTGYTELKEAKRLISQSVATQAPPATTYTATEIGKQITIYDKKNNEKTMSAIAVNKKLVELGYLITVGKKKDLSEEGKKWGIKIPFDNNGHKGYQIEWKIEVVELLK